MRKKEQILFIHQNFPGQFRSLAPALIKEGYEVHALGEETNIKQVDDYPNLKISQWFLDPLIKSGPDYNNNKRRILDKKDFLESLNHEQFEKIQTFFDTMPTVKYVTEVTNPKTKVKSEVTLEGMNSFF